MIKFNKNLILTLLLSLFTSVHFSYAQSLNEISEFKLNSEKEEIKKESISSLKNNDRFSGEFNLSLGSQMLSYQNASKVYPSEAKRIETGFNGIHSDIKLDDSRLNSSNQNEFDSIITLNNSYEDNAIGLGDSQTQVLSLSAKTGRLSFYGKYNQSSLSIGSGNTQSNNQTVSSMRASSSISENSSQDDNSNPSAISSNYYLEAVYSFKPNIKGKVAYKKTVVDAFDLKENVELEGIVDVSNDVSIKATYQNETRPDIENSNSGEKKVLTEFILKF